MKLIAIYREHEAITKVYCAACFTFLKLNDKFAGWKHTETTPVPGLDKCRACYNNQGPTPEQITKFLESEKKK